jgi:uncharacterized phiE125 gp8 family phage protein
MEIVQSGEPIGEVLSLALAKQHCRVRHSDDDTVIQHYITAAVDWVEEACQTVFLQTQFTATGNSLELDFTGYPNPVVSEITYTDPLGVAGDVMEWEVRDGQLYVPDKPDVSTVSVVFDAGLGAGNVPPKLVQAALMLTAGFYLQRADLTTDPANSVPMGVRAMIAQHRSFVFA